MYRGATDTSSYLSDVQGSFSFSFPSMVCLILHSLSANYRQNQANYLFSPIPLNIQFVIIICTASVGHSLWGRIAHSLTSLHPILPSLPLGGVKEPLGLPMPFGFLLAHCGAVAGGSQSPAGVWPVPSPHGSPVPERQAFPMTPRSRLFPGCPPSIPSLLSYLICTLQRKGEKEFTFLAPLLARNGHAILCGP